MRGNEIVDYRILQVDAGYEISVHKNGGEEPITTERYNDLTCLGHLVQSLRKQRGAQITFQDVQTAPRKQELGGLIKSILFPDEAILHAEGSSKERE